MNPHIHSKHSQPQPPIPQAPKLRKPLEQGTLMGSKRSFLETMCQATAKQGFVLDAQPWLHDLTSERGSKANLSI